MDLTSRIKDPSLIETAKQLAINGLMTYQPFVLSPEFEIGVGYEFELNTYSGLVYYPDIAPHRLDCKPLARLIVDPKNFDEFHAANRRLAAFYDFIADEIVEAVGGAKGHSFLDIGCNIGYFPQSFARRGADLAAGCDRQDFSAAFSLLNKILGTETTFTNAWYNPASHKITGLNQHDVVMSMAMICHVSDPMHLMASMAKLTKKALFIWTLINDDEGYTIHYGEPRGDYPDDHFPYCFDNKVCPSASLIRRSFELLGFSNIRELSAEKGSGNYSWSGYPFRGFLGIR